MQGVKACPTLLTLALGGALPLAFRGPPLCRPALGLGGSETRPHMAGAEFIGLSLTADSRQLSIASLPLPHERGRSRPHSVLSLASNR